MMRLLLCLFLTTPLIANAAKKQVSCDDALRALSSPQNTVSEDVKAVRIALAEQVHRNRVEGRDFDSAAIRNAVQQILKGEIDVSASLSPEIQAVVDEALRYSRAMGALSRLSVEDYESGRVEIFPGFAGDVTMPSKKKDGSFLGKFFNRTPEIKKSAPVDFVEQLNEHPIEERFKILQKNLKNLPQTLRLNEVLLIMRYVDQRDQKLTFEVLSDKISDGISLYTTAELLTAFVGIKIEVVREVLSDGQLGLNIELLKELVQEQRSPERAVLIELKSHLRLVDDVDWVTLEKLFERNKANTNNTAFKAIMVFQNLAIEEFKRQIDELKGGDEETQQMRSDLIRDELQKISFLTSEQWMDIYRQVPQDINWGLENNQVWRSITEPIKRLYGRDWTETDNYVPNEINIVWLGLQRVKVDQARNRRALDSIIRLSEEELKAYNSPDDANKKRYPPALISDIIKLFESERDRISDPKQTPRI